MIFALHLLAHHQDIQNEARKSIRKVLLKFNGEWCYEAVMDMNFLEQIIEGELPAPHYHLNSSSIIHSTPETLRIYPPVSDIHRWVSKDYRLPNGSILPRETAVIIPALAFSRDPNLFPDPMRFDPHRFHPEAKSQRHSFSTLPFGEGNRICIGMR